MEFNLPVSAGIVLMIVAAGTVGLLQADMGMADSTVLMMVAPSMAIFAAVVFLLGVKHGEYRASV